MSEQIILASAGSYLDTNGHVGPLGVDGLPCIGEGETVDVEDVSEEWVQALNADDLEVFTECLVRREGETA